MVHNEFPRSRSRGRILVADEDPAVASFVLETLRNDGRAVFHAYDGLSAVALAFGLDQFHLVISNTKTDGVACRRREGPTCGGSHDRSPLSPALDPLPGEDLPPRVSY